MSIWCSELGRTWFPREIIGQEAMKEKMERTQKRCFCDTDTKKTTDRKKPDKGVGKAYATSASPKQSSLKV